MSSAWDVASAHLRAGRIDAAHKAYRALLTANPDTVDAHLGLANCACVVGQVDAAVEELVSHAHGFATRGSTAGALRLLAKALEIAPSRLDLHIDVAQLEAASGRAELAIERLQTLAGAFSRAGQNDEALLVLDAAAALRTEPAPATTHNPAPKRPVLDGPVPARRNTTAPPLPRPRPRKKAKHGPPEGATSTTRRAPATSPPAEARLASPAPPPPPDFDLPRPRGGEPPALGAGGLTVTPAPHPSRVKAQRAQRGRALNSTRSAPGRTAPKSPPPSRPSSGAPNAQRAQRTAPRGPSKVRSAPARRESLTPSPQPAEPPRGPAQGLAARLRKISGMFSRPAGRSTAREGQPATAR